MPMAGGIAMAKCGAKDVVGGVDLLPQNILNKPF
jgi:hypothetical protein